MISSTESADQPHAKPVQELDTASVRFAGDSGDGMQLAGNQFTNASAVFGNDVSTLPDFPAEIRAPAGTTYGVSGFQVSFSAHDIHTPGDQVDALIAMNPAALKTNLPSVIEGGIVIVNVDEFTPQNLAKAGYATNPLEDGSLDRYRLYKVPITRHTLEAVKDTGLGAKAAARCKNFYALGLVCWLYDRPLDAPLKWIEQKFANNPDVKLANTLALKAGYHFGETAELFPSRFRVPRATLPPGRYRNLTGNQAMAIGLITAARLAGKPLFYGSYPITPASDILHELARYKNFDVITFQAEDEIAAMTSCIGAAFAGCLAATASSGPGIALKTEAIGLAVMTELPVVIINVQRAGPSTGMPTKTEQADLLQALFGRNGECPVAVLAPRSPADCFDIAIEAFRIATRYMVPVMVLSDGYLGNGAEPWRIPDPETLQPIRIQHPTTPNDDGHFRPYLRNEFLARPWAIPGTPGLEHRLGGLEKSDGAGEVCYDPDNHEKMVRLRAEKVQGIVRDIPPTSVQGDRQGDLLVVGWGSTYGAITTAVSRARARGQAVSAVHLRHLNPLPPDLGDILRGFRRVLVPELNSGQLCLLLRARYLVDAVGLSKIQGLPFTVREISQKIDELLNPR